MKFKDNFFIESATFYLEIDKTFSTKESKFNPKLNNFSSTKKTKEIIAEYIFNNFIKGKREKASPSLKEKVFSIFNKKLKIPKEKLEFPVLGKDGKKHYINLLTKDDKKIVDKKKIVNPVQLAVNTKEDDKEIEDFDSVNDQNTGLSKFVRARFVKGGYQVVNFAIDENGKVTIEARKIA